MLSLGEISRVSSVMEFRESFPSFLTSYSLELDLDFLFLDFFSILGLVFSFFLMNWLL